MTATSCPEDETQRDATTGLGPGEASGGPLEGRTFLPELWRTFPPFLPGQVWLAGAGPGGLANVTLGALYALDRCDVVVYDALVEKRLVEMAGAKAEFAGKRGGRPSPCQSAISLTLIKLARQKKRVLRLKGGDPFLFARGGEEIRALLEAGLVVRVLPGVSAVQAGAAAHLIPLTQRGLNSTLVFLTGHDLHGDSPLDLDWRAIARASPTLVFYMALRTIRTLSARLIEAGRNPEEPLVFMSKLGSPEARTSWTTLGEAGAKAAHHEAPCLMILGENVRLGAAWEGLLKRIEGAGTAE